MPAARIALALGLMSLAGCASFSGLGPPPSCPDAPGTGITSNAPHDGTTGASGTSSTSNGTGSTIDPTAPPCR